MFILKSIYTQKTEVPTMINVFKIPKIYLNLFIQIGT